MWRRFWLLASVLGSAAHAQSEATSGSYLGNGLDFRPIDAGFLPGLVIIQGGDGKGPVLRTASMPVDAAKSLGAHYF